MYINNSGMMYGGPNPPLYKTFAPRFYKTSAPRFYKTFAPRFYNFLHDFTISSTILQFPPRFYNFLHDFTISSTILQFPPRFYNFLHDFTISSTILQFPPRYYNFLHDFENHARKCIWHCFSCEMDYLSTRLRSFTRLKARERFRRLVLRLTHLALETMPYAYHHG